MPERNKEKGQNTPSSSKGGAGERTKARCPICHAVVSLGALYGHITVNCKKHGGVDRDKDG